MADSYDFHTIEPKWQYFWEAHGLFRAVGPGEPGFDPDQPKYYVLNMFPYPSGAGLHVGHPLSYTAVDIIARYKRAKGFNVLNPIGWDSFGLPAEQQAVKTGFPPQATTLNSINTFRRQLKRLGFSYDWDREIATSDERYFRWTQWIFLQLFEHGLAYKDDAPVWWCEGLGTVLANEEVNDEGLSEIGSHPCVRLPLSQWFLRITDYSDRLLEDIETVGWPEHIKEMQRNWIGRSTGAELIFHVAGGEADGEEIRVYTTRPDTVFGATYMVLAPEHPLVEPLTGDDQREAVERYRTQASRRSERSRLTETGKTGVWTGGWATNPANGERIPVWISDYVLMGYGTGAIMAVPAHDERDFDFAVEFDLEIVEVVKAPDGEEPEILRRHERDGSELVCFVTDGVAVNSGALDGLTTAEAKERIVELLAADGNAEEAVRYKLRDWLFSRQRYWGEPIPLLFDEADAIHPVEEGELPITLPATGDFQPTGSPDPPLSKQPEWMAATLADGSPARREANVMPQWAGSCWYYLRFLDPHNEEAAWDAEKERYWMPVDMYIGGAEHAVLHLLYARFWHKVLYDRGLVSTVEPFERLFNQGMILGEAYRVAETGSYIPSEQVEFDGDRPLHPETGAELERAVVKMSKSIGNVVNPDEVIAEFGADTFRVYEMSLGPLDGDKPWDTRAIQGSWRLLQRVWRLIVGGDDDRFDTPCRDHLLHDEGEASPELERLLHKTIDKVGSDIEGIAFNTAIAQLTIFVNEATRDPKRLTRAQALRLVQILAPFAPHLAEECWLRLGRTDHLMYAAWPEADPALLVDDSVKVAVQVNGKRRGTIEIPKDAAEADVLAQAKASESVARHLEGKELVREIYVPGRIVNLVVR